MSTNSDRRQVPLLLLLAALLLRASIPAGYMPAALGSGLLFEFCPSGVPAEFMQALAGSAGHHHHVSAQDQGGHFDAEQCPIGHMLSSAVAFDDYWTDGPETDAAIVFEPAVDVFTSTSRAVYRARGPPA
jgi:hypothetical protein